MVTFIGKYENREADLLNIEQEVGCTGLEHIHTMRTTQEGQHYSQFYDMETRNIVKELFAKDIEMFGYEY